ncbi:hypothetical protein LUZ63_004422 [Rhynchospora breviuscula]|uniref:cyclin-dependent kinase n=1 Tax=Rhynchospora breviuscula TaxID=2022672 RepID=A0A9Q0D3A2_9POAL|nr:hypothetical protein LUZ63_004422 [Rhynchospora breviuscula]
MEKYNIIKEIGDGSGGNVFKAYQIHTKETVAIKKMKRKFNYLEEVRSLRELQALNKLSHPNVITLKEAIVENQDLYLVFEHMDKNLYEAMRERDTHFSEEDIKGLMYQILGGLAYIHKNGYFHRDLKPENLLLKDGVVKIADLGLARELDSKPPYTEYVSTRWYRAPEVLLKCTSYGPAVDMWAVGAILAELYRCSPLFPGDSEIDQLCKICNVLGSPDTTIWPELMNFPRSLDFNLIQVQPGANLLTAIPNASLEAIDLFMQLCSWDPRRRPTAEQTMQHPYFYGRVPKSLEDHFISSFTRHGENINLELSLWDDSTYTDESALELTLGPMSFSSIDVANNNSNGYISQHHREDAVLHDHYGMDSDLWQNHAGLYDFGALGMSMISWQHPQQQNIADTLAVTAVKGCSCGCNISRLEEPNLDLSLFNYSSDGSTIDHPIDHHTTDFFQ